ncbi:hypothetical protein CAEBREN_16343 [Caenorhabditis brenneri]|uniref:Uncharacterized protein n=1 Tax=Caenorhabditis brenneri TaxID=135651 RepID=G0NPI5_CAEBE|nr:hypothetical protein CAEBREN_16343 [Caenorhabditis brenneri]
MPFSFLNFPYLVKKNMVDQMTYIDLVRVSLQNQAADNSLRECGKPDVSFYKLNYYRLKELSSFDKLELFICEAKRSGITASWPINLSVSIHDAYFFSLKNDKGFEVRIFVDNPNNFDKYDRTLKMGDLNVPCVIAEDSKVEIYTLLARRRVSYQIERELYGFGSCSGSVTAGHGGKLFEMSVYHGE